jgi:drug/metabolite transporter (DMT)-like permease
MHHSQSPLRGVLLVLLAATLWGTLGTIYTWGSESLEMTPVTIVFWRAALASIALGLVLGGVRPLVGKGWRLLRVRRADLPIFVTFGVLGVTAFYVLYIYAVVLVGVAVAVVLLYTAPIFVSLMAWKWLGESFGTRRVLALLLTFLGCALVARVYNPELLQVNALGIVCGLGSAFTYALYSILGKLSLGRGYGISTMSFYVYTIGAAGLLVVALVTGPAQLFSMGTDLAAWGLLLTLAVVQTLGALAAYTAALRYLDAGAASILATFEPVVAALLAFSVLDERIEWPQMLGGGFIMAAVLLLQARTSKRRRSVPVPQEQV